MPCDPRKKLRQHPRVFFTNSTRNRVEARFRNTFIRGKYRMIGPSVIPRVEMSPRLSTPECQLVVTQFIAKHRTVSQIVNIVSASALKLVAQHISTRESPASVSFRRTPPIFMNLSLLPRVISYPPHQVSVHGQCHPDDVSLWESRGRHHPGSVR